MSDNWPTDVQNRPIDRIWAAEFRGYFFGDGFLGIVRNGMDHRSGLPANTARAQITTCDDDADMVRDIAARLGGRVYGDVFASGHRLPSHRKPVVVWRTRNMSDVARVCTVLEAGIMPSKKRAEVAVMRRYLALRLPLGRPPAEVDMPALRAAREQCMIEIQDLHAYHQPSDSARAKWS